MLSCILRPLALWIHIGDVFFYFFFSLIYAGSILQADQLFAWHFYLVFVITPYRWDDYEWEEWKCNNIVTMFPLVHRRPRTACHLLICCVCSLFSLPFFKFSSVIAISLLRPACSCFSVYAAWPQAIALYTALRPACIKKCIIMKPCKMKCDLPHVAAQIAQARLFERASHHHLFIPPCIL